MPPSTASALNPIVISEIQVPPHFTTLGTGLLHCSHPRESVQTLTTILLNSSLIPNSAKPKSWWRAQCLLYGLDAPQSRSIQSLRETLEIALRCGRLTVPDELVDLEHSQNGRFRKLNAQVREATMGAAGVQNDKKAKGVKSEGPLKRVLGASKVARKSAPAAKAVAAQPKQQRVKKAAAKAPVLVKKQAKKPVTSATTTWATISRGQLPAQGFRTKQTARRSTGGFPIGRVVYRTDPEPKPVRPKQTARRSRGGGARSSRPTNRQAAPSSPKPPNKLTARRGRGGGKQVSSRGGAAPQPAPRPAIQSETPHEIYLEDDGDHRMLNYDADDGYLDTGGHELGDLEGEMEEDRDSYGQQTYSDSNQPSDSDPELSDSNHGHSDSNNDLWEYGDEGDYY